MCVFIIKKKYEEYPGLLASTHFVIYFDLSKTNNVSCNKCNNFLIGRIIH